MSAYLTFTRVAASGGKEPKVQDAAVCPDDRFGLGAVSGHWGES